MVNIIVRNAILRRPIDQVILQKGIALLNVIFNSTEFENELSKQSFVVSNKPGFSLNGLNITGKQVYDELIGSSNIFIDIQIRRGGLLSVGFFKKVFFGTMGETDPSGSTIVTYNSWLKQLDDNELFILYTTHIGHEIFHTKYFGFVHDPKYGSREFLAEKDVTYKIDEILESLIRKELEKG
jgi:hypothetical protein